MEQVQKQFPRYFNKVEVCGHCNGHGTVDVYPDGDIYKRFDPETKVCPLCEGSGMVEKHVTILVDLKPFRRRQ